MTKENKIRKIVILAIMGVFAGLLLYSGTKLIQHKINEQENQAITEIVEKTIEVDEESETLAEKYKVDFVTLKEQNPDVVAYLKVNGTNIDYIVVRGDDNEYYLKHNLNRNWNVLGWVFADYRNR